MIRAIRIHEHGGPEVLRFEAVELPMPAAGEVRVRHAAIGVNFIDTYHRTGLYPLPALPAILGREAAGTVEAVGDGVVEFAVGQRVAYPMHPGGSYADAANVRAHALVPVPDDVDLRAAAAMMLKGLTAWYLLRRTHRVGAGETILFHAAAGGVGRIACAWAAHLGATVLGTVGSDAKAEIARAHGCAETIVYTRESFVERVREFTGGAGVPVVYDSVGRDTFDGSLACLAPLGTLVSFGQSSGPVPPFDILRLSTSGSLFLTRPTLATHIARREDLLAGAAELFDVVRSGAVHADIGAEYPLREAATAHRDLEGRRTSGSVVLLP